MTHRVRQNTHANEPGLPRNDETHHAPLNLLALFDDLEFPASLPELVEHALDQGASEEVLENIRAMPDRDYDSVQEINRYHNRIETLPGQGNLYSSSPANKNELPTESIDKPVRLRRR